MASSDLAPARRRNRSRGNRPRRPDRRGEPVSRFWKIVVTAALVVASLYFLVPVYWLVIAATKSTGQLFTTPGLLPADFHLWDNLVELSTHDGGIFWRWTLNSAVYSVFGSLLTTLVCAVTGYALAVYRFAGRRTIIGIVLASMLVPGTVLAQPTYVLLVHIGLNNTYAGILLPALVYPFGVLLCFIYAQSSIPYELIEASRLDGAGEFRTFVSVGMRLMGNGLVTVVLFAFLASWNNYLLPLLVLTERKLMPLTVGLTGWEQSSTSVAGLQGLVISGSLVSVVPIALVFVSLQRYWRQGLTTGGLKG